MAKEYSVLMPLTVMLGTGGPTIVYGPPSHTCPAADWVRFSASGDIGVYYLNFANDDTIRITYRIVASPGWVFNGKHRLKQSKKKKGQPNDAGGEWNFREKHRRVESSGRDFVLVDGPSTWATWDFSYDLINAGNEYKIDPEITNTDDTVQSLWKWRKGRKRHRRLRRLNPENIRRARKAKSGKKSGSKKKR